MLWDHDENSGTLIDCCALSELSPPSDYGIWGPGAPTFRGPPFLAWKGELGDQLVAPDTEQVLFFSLSRLPNSLCVLLQYDTRWALYLSRFISVRLSPLLSISSLSLCTVHHYISANWPEDPLAPWRWSHCPGAPALLLCRWWCSQTVTQWSRH